jgi:hypothetical protein
VASAEDGGLLVLMELEVVSLSEIRVDLEFKMEVGLGGCGTDDEAGAAVMDTRD